MAKKSKIQIEDPHKTRKVLITDRKEFLYIRTFLESTLADFDYTSSGSVNTIIWTNAAGQVIEYQNVDLQDSGGKGHHLTRRFKKDVDNWIAEYGASLQPWPAHYKEQMFNLSAIEKSIGKPQVAIDINDCYWRTTLKLTYITDETYILGLKKKEWKTGRNACIGGLKKTKTITPYRLGKPQHKLKPPPIKSPIEHEYIRNHIITYVYQLFFRLYEELGDDFCMFLTDCIFTDYSNKKKVEQFFSDNGYGFKSKPIDFLAVDRKEKKITWYDYEAVRKDKDGMVIGKGLEKYYYYSNSQVVDGVLEPTLTDIDNKI